MRLEFLVNANVKSRQFCSVCKEWLEMDIVPTNDGDDDDGVIWYRCPQCQGFLPKLKNAVDAEEPAPESAEAVDETVSSEADTNPDPEEIPSEISPGILPETSPEEEGSETEVAEVAVLESVDSDFSEPVAEKDPEPEIPEEKEPIQEYATMLADVDPASATPYRPWANYAVGQCVHHLAWDDCGVVVDKETLPGNRNVIKVYFETAGVVRLIEKAPR